MRTYDYKCTECGRQREHWRAEKSRNVPFPCTRGNCDGYMRRVYTPVTSMIEGMAGDRFKLQDKVAANRQKAHEEGW